VPSLVIVVSAVLVLSCRHTNRHTDAQTDMDEHFTPATLVGMSNNKINIKNYFTLKRG